MASIATQSTVKAEKFANFCKFRKLAEVKISGAGVVVFTDKNISPEMVFSFTSIISKALKKVSIFWVIRGWMVPERVINALTVGKVSGYSVSTVSTAGDFCAD